MNGINQISHEFVEFIPERLEQGVIYVSRRYSTASHLCCCGCGLKVVTPLNAAKWQLSERNGTISLHPSIGNWSFPCKSHYWIDAGSVRWGASMSRSEIAQVRARDQRDAELVFAPSAGRLAAIRNWVGKTWRKAIERLR